jgi:hypothetical protein
MPGRADSLIVDATDEGTRTIDGDSPPSLIHPTQQLMILVDGADHMSVDSDVEFDIASITTLPHGVTVHSARLFLDIAGARTQGLRISLGRPGAIGREQPASALQSGWLGIEPLLYHRSSG